MPGYTEIISVVMWIWNPQQLMIKRWVSFNQFNFDQLQEENYEMNWIQLLLIFDNIFFCSLTARSSSTGLFLNHFPVELYSRDTMVKPMLARSQNLHVKIMTAPPCHFSSETINSHKMELILRRLGQSIKYFWRRLSWITEGPYKILYTREYEDWGGEVLKSEKTDVFYGQPLKQSTLSHIKKVKNHMIFVVTLNRPKKGTTAWANQFIFHLHPKRYFRKMRT